MDPEQHPTHPDTPHSDPHAQVDVEALAERVYRLMVAEARLDRVRAAGLQRPRRG